MPQVFMVNPSPRKRRAKARKSSRKASPAQRAARARFAAMARARSAGPRRTRRRKAAVYANPSPRRAHVRAIRRKVRRNPSSRGMSLPSVRNITGTLKDAGIGAAGGIAVDMLMGQAIKVLPDSMKSRYSTEGNINFMYYLAKASVAVAAGIVGAKVLPGSMRGLAAKAVLGSLTVQAYELGRASLPADFIAMGYYQPALVQSAPNGKPTGQNRGMGYYPRLVRPGMAGPTSSIGASSMAGSRIG